MATAAAAAVGLLGISKALALPRDTVTATLVVYGAKGMGKRLALDTPLPTPTGWTTMGDVAVGDTLFDDLGLPCRVVAISPIVDGDSYRIVFSDRSSIVADAEHLWQTIDYRDRTSGKPSIHTTAEIRATLHTRQGKQLACTYAIENAEPLNLPDGELPVPPYTLGAWLGDGRSQSAYLTTADVQVLDEIRAEGVSIGDPLQGDHSGRANTYWIGGGGRRKNTLCARLNRLGLLGNKHVPPIYLRAGRRQRLALLQGLMDSDGYWNAAGSVAEFDNSNAQLADDVYELVVSLGMKATRSSKAVKSTRHDTSYRVRFVPTLPVFRLARKYPGIRQERAQSSRKKRRYITAVDPIASVPMRCIAVDSLTNLYLAGRAMVPTHNTNFGAVLVEELKAAGLRFAVIDPVGVWWGLQHSATGKGPGIEVLVLGGVHGDLPILPTAGAVVADMVADEEVDIVIDVSRHATGKMWSQGEKIRFVTDYATRLYERQGERMRPVHQVFDEAGRFVPQNIPTGSKDLPACVGAIEQLVELGRNVGVGVTLITQRSARMNKSVSELADAMIAFRTVGPRSVAAILDWFGEHVPRERWNALVEKLRSLPIGTALVVSPGWLQFEGAVPIRARRTFDSSATPGAEPRVAVGRASKPDLARYSARMAETIDRAKADDPRELRKRIAELERLLRDSRNTDHQDLEIQLSGVRAKLADATARIAVMESDQNTRLRTIARLRDALQPVVDDLTGLINGVPFHQPPRASVPSTFPDHITREGEGIWLESGDKRVENVPPPITVPAPAPRTPRADGEVTVTTPQQRILDALAMFEMTGVSQVSKSNVAVFADQSPSSSSFANNLGALRTRGLISYPSGGMVALTDEGHERATPAETITTLADLHSAWERRLSRPQWAIVRKLIHAYPLRMERTDLAVAVGQSSNSSSYANNLGALRTLGLIDYPTRGQAVATSLLFPDLPQSS